MNFRAGASVNRTRLLTSFVAIVLVGVAACGSDDPVTRKIAESELAEVEVAEVEPAVAEAAPDSLAVEEAESAAEEQAEAAGEVVSAEGAELVDTAGASGVPLVYAGSDFSVTAGDVISLDGCNPDPRPTRKVDLAFGFEPENPRPGAGYVDVDDLGTPEDTSDDIVEFPDLLASEAQAVYFWRVMLTPVGAEEVDLGFEPISLCAVDIQGAMTPGKWVFRVSYFDEEVREVLAQLTQDLEPLKSKDDRNVFSLRDLEGVFDPFEFERFIIDGLMSFDDVIVAVGPPPVETAPVTVPAQSAPATTTAPRTTPPRTTPTQTTSPARTTAPTTTMPTTSSSTTTSTTTTTTSTTTTTTTTTTMPVISSSSTTSTTIL